MLLLGILSSLTGGRVEGQESFAPKPVLPQLPRFEPSAGSVDSVEARLQKLEAINERVLRENEELREQVKELSGRIETAAEAAPTGVESTAPARSLIDDDLEAGPNLDPEMGLGNEFGLSTGTTPEGTGGKNSLFGRFDKGFVFATEDDEYLMRFSNETQVESRIFQQGGLAIAHNGIYIPRQIWSFSGRVTKPFEYSVSINKGLGSINLRDAYLNIHYDDRVMFRMGRWRVPYTYEFYANSNVELLAPERSVFAVNYGLNRMIGFQLWGELFDKRLDYAVGGFNGTRNGFEDSNGSLDTIAYLNARPFQKSERLEFLKYLNIGGSVAFGDEDNPLKPQALRTAVNASTSEGAAASSPTFLIFGDRVTETGHRELWNLHMAYFYKSLSLLAEWDQGYESYSKGTALPVRVPVSGYYVQAGYVLTGETLEKRKVISPDHPFSLKPGHFGLGAFEVHGRYAAINVSQDVFTAGLADPNLWSNSAGVIDTGMNWYLSRYLKVYFDWQHSVFGSPVFYAPGGLQKTADMFWLRCQLYF